mmetsp:Transcript_4156/g.6383  ORF Transcript_4156/g.6383 Transcript_4156/m.6383 type:complete len:125 (+) Transcript_4156:80-454(+)
MRPPKTPCGARRHAARAAVGKRLGATRVIRALHAASPRPSAVGRSPPRPAPVCGPPPRAGRTTTMIDQNMLTMPTVEYEACEEPPSLLLQRATTLDSLVSSAGRERYPTTEKTGSCCDHPQTSD